MVVYSFVLQKRFKSAASKPYVDIESLSQILDVAHFDDCLDHSAKHTVAKVAVDIV